MFKHILEIGRAALQNPAAADLFISNHGRKPGEPGLV